MQINLLLTVYFLLSFCAILRGQDKPTSFLASTGPCRTRAQSLRQPCQSIRQEEEHNKQRDKNMQVVNDDKQTRTVTLTENDLLTITVLMKKGAKAWKKETGQDVSKDLQLANVFSNLHCDLLTYRLEEEGRL